MSRRGGVLFTLAATGLAVASVMYVEPRQPTLLSVVEAASTATTAATTTTLPVTTTMSTTPSSPEMIAALDRIPDEILEPLGGRESVRVVAYDTIDSALEGWTGGLVAFADGAAVMGEGAYSRSELLSAPFAVVGRVSYGEPGGFEISAEWGTWDTPGFRRWGVYGGGDGLQPNVWQGATKLEPYAFPIPTEADTDHWIVVAVNEASAMYGIWREGSDSAAAGATMPLDWGIADWRLAIQVFPDGGTLIVDEYYVLSP